MPSSRDKSAERTRSPSPSKLVGLATALLGNAVRGKDKASTSVSPTSPFFPSSASSNTTFTDYNNDPRKSLTSELSPISRSASTNISATSSVNTIAHTYGELSPGIQSPGLFEGSAPPNAVPFVLNVDSGSSGSLPTSDQSGNASRAVSYGALSSRMGTSAGQLRSYGGSVGMGMGMGMEMEMGTSQSSVVPIVSAPTPPTQSIEQIQQQSPVLSSQTPKGAGLRVNIAPRPATRQRSSSDAPYQTESLPRGFGSAQLLVNRPPTILDAESNTSVTASAAELSPFPSTNSNIKLTTPVQPKQRSRFMTFSAKSGTDLTSHLPTLTPTSAASPGTTDSTTPVLNRQTSRHPQSPSSRAASQISLMSMHSMLSVSGSTNRLAPPSRRPSISGEVKETNILAKELDPTTGNKMINKYMVIRELGRGVYGKVKYCVDIETNEEVAIKIVEKRGKKRFQNRLSLSARLSQQNAENGGGTPIPTNPYLEKIQREIAIMKKCDHPHVVKLLEVIDDPAAEKIYLVLEFLPGGELKWTDGRDPPGPIIAIDEVRRIFRDVVCGVEYLHYQGIVHRDIKPANLLLTEDHRVKMSDFGVSAFTKERKRKRTDTATKDENESDDAAGSEEEVELAKTAGTPAFFAPELCGVSDEDERLFAEFKAGLGEEQPHDGGIQALMGVAEDGDWTPEFSSPLPTPLATPSITPGFSRSASILSGFVTPGSAATPEVMSNTTMTPGVIDSAEVSPTTSASPTTVLLAPVAMPPAQMSFISVASTTDVFGRPVPLTERTVMPEEEPDSASSPTGDSAATTPTIMIKPSMPARIPQSAWSNSAGGSEPVSPSTEIKMVERHAPRIGKAIDIWALGVTLYCFVFGRVPFIADTEFELFNVIAKQPLEFPDYAQIDGQLRDLFLRILDKNPDSRITLEEIKQHPWTTADLTPDERAIWLRETDVSLNYGAPFVVTDEEVRGAFTIMGKIRDRIRKLSSSFQNLTSTLRRRTKSMSHVLPPPDGVPRKKNDETNTNGTNSNNTSIAASPTTTASTIPPVPPLPATVISSHSWIHHSPLHAMTSFTTTSTSQLTPIPNTTTSTADPRMMVSTNTLPTSPQINAPMLVVNSVSDDIPPSSGISKSRPTSRKPSLVAVDDPNTQQTPLQQAHTLSSSIRLHSPVKRHSPLIFADVPDPVSNESSVQGSLRMDSSMRVESSASVASALSAASSDGDEGVNAERERMAAWQQEQGLDGDEEEDGDDDLDEVRTS
ncbi:hypothetical protein SmJEL517_g01468 [Synchytrium microbalum]|uniref:Protein kinase domain-containing protein n=1 Tax=Synchytrium microbalum TaxID=1806994 RepID=A0A507CA89_9FUNG|nr:uncharacterized protein SmJEL517_g01468 [Synchytrium microbalum]TPX36258.1 hypothetical protein SmJEL517_g01468 [Synchytrium microbalum]